MKKNVFCAVCTLLNGDEWKLGFFESEADAWAFIDPDKSGGDLYSYAVRSLIIDDVEGESLLDAFRRIDREDNAADPDRYSRLLNEFDLW